MIGRPESESLYDKDAYEMDMRLGDENPPRKAGHSRLVYDKERRTIVPEMRSDIEAAINKIVVVIADAVCASGMSRDEVDGLKKALSDFVVAIKR